MLQEYHRMKCLSKAFLYSSSEPLCFCIEPSLSESPAFNAPYRCPQPPISHYKIAFIYRIHTYTRLRVSLPSVYSIQWPHLQG